MSGKRKVSSRGSPWGDLLGYFQRSLGKAAALRPEVKLNCKKSSASSGGGPCECAGYERGKGGRNDLSTAMRRSGKTKKKPKNENLHEKRDGRLSRALPETVKKGRKACQRKSEASDKTGAITTVRNEEIAFSVYKKESKKDVFENLHQARTQWGDDW